MSKKSFDVVIVGAGASGLAAAWKLSLSHLKILVLEQGKKYNQNEYHKKGKNWEVKKTKEFNMFLEKNKLSNILIISDTDSLKNINKSARNIKNVKIIKDEGTNIYDLFKYKNVLITSSSAKKLQNRILNEKN